jgi:hypothetical protein
VNVIFYNLLELKIRYNRTANSEYKKTYERIFVLYFKYIINLHEIFFLIREAKNVFHIFPHFSIQYVIKKKKKKKL